MSEQKYTLEEAQQLLSQQYCATYGHDQTNTTVDGELVRIVCERCSKAWKVVPE